ncbi:uncharacterized protein LOC112494607 [Cephus cinctus]|uniref:Uncharacterized protein LOC112494607 n=1 Tax=Cephus cinctus TaxID=211228 RepID=A0AAJ7RLL2_CEPCN|nr:uncharacterized protein LOC112494607 [Cephus cinctus]
MPLYARHDSSAQLCTTSSPTSLAYFSTAAQEVPGIEVHIYEGSNSTLRVMLPTCPPAPLPPFAFSRQDNRAALRPGFKTFIPRRDVQRETSCSHNKFSAVWVSE